MNLDDLGAFATLRVAAADLNGQMRGKRVPGSFGTKLDRGAVRMPFSALNVDLWGADIHDSPLVFDAGDADGVLRPTARGPVPMPWIAAPTALVPMSMYHDSGRPFSGDPRHALKAILERFADRGWQVMAATEMEFTLLDDTGQSPLPPRNPMTGRALAGEAILSLAEMDAFDSFFTALYDGCRAMGIPAQSAISESGVGQFEVALEHQPALRAADDAWLFKALVRGLARAHGFSATFMAKPYADDAGNGMHVHFSVLDENGDNIFNDGGPRGTDTLRHAVAGCLKAMPDSTVIFAPHANSYNRYVDGAHAPTTAVWAYDNRTVALRIPGGQPVARRIEHRVAGGDMNPYLGLAAILGAALTGIEDGDEPSAPVTGNAYELDGLPTLEHTMGAAIDRFAASERMARIFPKLLIDNLVLTKRQEMTRFAALPPEQHWLAYLETV
ncbi:glutamine synthetase family protein [Chachezhania sediminis]|uniref:glutamine synthetase family protein n=1 Tax=Chachezhania sediminis TaxID=2599291 RepID=UPI00131C3C79|nr:glutamine synthetase family protein [Chachezhania sediminis]